MPLNPQRLMEQIKRAMPASIDALYELAFDESASCAARQYAIRNVLRHGYARPESPHPDPNFSPEPISEKTREALQAILARLK